MKTVSSWSLHHLRGRYLGAAPAPKLAHGHDGICIVAENCHELTPGPREVLYVLDATDGAVGHLIDTGYRTGSPKCDDLAAIVSAVFGGTR